MHTCCLLSCRRAAAFFRSQPQSHAIMAAVTKGQRTTWHLLSILRQKQLHIRVGTSNQHSPRHTPRPGSDKPPVIHSTAVTATPPIAQLESTMATNNNTIQPNQPSGLVTIWIGPARSYFSSRMIMDDGAQGPTLDENSSVTVAAADSPTHPLIIPLPCPSVSHSLSCSPLIKHIQRSAHQHIAIKLTSVLNCITSNPVDPSNWSSFLSIESNMLSAPPRVEGDTIWYH
jgi:hypothetical protein